MGDNYTIKSIHIDESGDFSIGNDPANLLVVSITLAYDSPNILSQVQEFESELQQCGFSGQIHTAPLVRMEKDFKDIPLGVRRDLFWKTYNFSRLSDCDVYSFIFDKNSITDKKSLQILVHEKLTSFFDTQLLNNPNFIVFYDGGQHPLETILYDYFEDNPCAEFIVDFDKDKDRFYQLADFDTYIHLLVHKVRNNLSLSKSEKQFFRSDDLRRLVKYVERWRQIED